MPNNEKKVCNLLNQQSISSFTPTIKILRQWSDRKKIIERPLFPSYVFIYLKNSHDYLKGLSIEGVWHFVKIGKQLSKIPEQIVNNIRISTERGKGLEASPSRFDKGQSIVIKEGPLTGLTGEIVDCNGRQKILVRLNIIQNNILVDLPTDHVMHSDCLLGPPLSVKSR